MRLSQPIKRRLKKNATDSSPLIKSIPSIVGDLHFKAMTICTLDSGPRLQTLEPKADQAKDLKAVAGSDDNSEMHLQRNPITAIMKC